MFLAGSWIGPNVVARKGNNWSHKMSKNTGRNTPGLSKSPSASNRKRTTRTAAAAVAGDERSVTSGTRSVASVSRSVASVSTWSTGSKCPGLPPFLLKQLLKDIEHPDVGGIDRLRKKGDHSLSNILDKRLDIDQGKLYAKRGDPIRSHILKCVNRWKNLTRQAYLESVLDRHQVQSVGYIYISCWLERSVCLLIKISLLEEVSSVGARYLLY